MLAREVYAAETLEGGVGSAVGAAAGSIAGLAAASAYASSALVASGTAVGAGSSAIATLGVAGYSAAFVFTGVGVFAGVLAGALIGDALVGGAPNPHVSAHLSYNQDGFLTVHIDPDDWSSDGERDDLLEYGRVMSDLTNASLNGAVEAMGSFVEVIDMPASMVVYSSDTEIIDNGDGSRTLKLTFADFESKASFDVIAAAKHVGTTVICNSGEDRLNVEVWRRRPSPESLLLRYRCFHGGYRFSHGGYRPSGYLSQAAT